MDYIAIHNKIIDGARNRVLEDYTETHHIIPRCMGGTDDADNLVRLTAREHYVIHQLLIKINPENPKLVKAAYMMTVDRHGGRVNNRRYAWLKERNNQAHSQLMTGRKHSKQTIEKMVIARNKRAPISDETRIKMSEAATGRIHSTETRIKMSVARKGKAKSIVHITNAGNARKGISQKEINCPHCDMKGSISNMKRWHFDNCKMNEVLYG